MLFIPGPGRPQWVWTSKRRVSVRVRTLVRLSYLAPGIIRALLAGRHPTELTPTRLLRLSKDLPHDWQEQRQFLGFGLPGIGVAHAARVFDRAACLHSTRFSLQRHIGKFGSGGHYEGICLAGAIPRETSPAARTQPLSGDILVLVQVSSRKTRRSGASRA
jgi:hypothetical protein